WRSVLLTQGLLVCAQNLLPPKSAVLSSCVLRSGLLSARRTGVQASILRSALRRAGLSAGGCSRFLSARRTGVQASILRSPLRWAGLSAGGCSGFLPVGRSGVRTTLSGLLSIGSPTFWHRRSRAVPGAPPVGRRYGIAPASVTPPAGAWPWPAVPRRSVMSKGSVWLAAMAFGILAWDLSVSALAQPEGSERVTCPEGY